MLICLVLAWCCKPATVTLRCRSSRFGRKSLTSILPRVDNRTSGKPISSDIVDIVITVPPCDSRNSCESTLNGKFKLKRRVRDRKMELLQKHRFRESHRLGSLVWCVMRVHTPFRSNYVRPLEESCLHARSQRGAGDLAVAGV
jgi:hypothetical protein